MNFEEIMLNCFGVSDIQSVQYVDVRSVSFINDTDAGTKYLYNTIHELNNGCNLSEKSKRSLIGIIHRATCWMLSSITTKSKRDHFGYPTNRGPQVFESILNRSNIERSLVAEMTNVEIEWFESIAINYYQPIWSKQDAIKKMNKV